MRVVVVGYWLQENSRRSFSTQGPKHELCTTLWDMNMVRCDQLERDLFCGMLWLYRATIEKPLQDLLKMQTENTSQHWFARSSKQTVTWNKSQWKNINHHNVHWCFRRWCFASLATSKKTSSVIPGTPETWKKQHQGTNWRCFFSVEAWYEMYKGTSNLIDLYWNLRDHS